MEHEVRRRVLKQTNLIQCLEHSLEVCEHKLYDLSILIEELKNSNKEITKLTNIGAQKPKPSHKNTLEFSTARSRGQKSAAGSSSSNFSFGNLGTECLENKFKRMNTQYRPPPSKPARNKAKN